MTPRPATRRQPEPTAAAPRPAVRDFSRAPASFELEWDVRPVYDFLFSLSEDAGATDDLPADDRRWLADARASLPEADRASVARLIPAELSIFVAAFAIERPAARTVAAFLDELDAADPTDFLRSILADPLHDLGADDLFDRLAAGDPDAAAELAARLPEHKASLATLAQGPERAQREIAVALRAWATKFAEIETRVAEILARDVELRAADRRSLDGLDLIERVTGGIRWLPEPGVERVVLAPSYFSRPYNFVLAGSGWRFFGYPVADAAIRSGDPIAPSMALLRFHRALGDPTRLRILKLLAGQDLYLTEIAQLLDLSKPTIKHHLAQLRAAGLVTIVDGGAVTYYSLRRERLEDASGEVRAYLTN